MVGTDISGARPKPMDFQLCLCLVTFEHLDYESQLKISKHAGWDGVGIPMKSIEEYLATGKSMDEAKDLLQGSGLRPVEMLSFRDWIYAKGKAQTEMLDRFGNFSRASAQLGCRILNATTRFAGDHDEALARENFKEVCRIAENDGNRVGLEYLPYSPIHSIKKAWSVVRGAGAANGGIVLDPFHYFRGGSRMEDLREVPIEKIFDVHIDDLKDTNPETDLQKLTRNYRVFPGEGDFVFDDFLEYLFERGYSGYYSLEVLNKNNRNEDPLKLAIRARESLEKLLKDYAQKRLQRTG